MKTVSGSLKKHPTMTNPFLPIVLRPATEQDLGFVYKSWLESYRNSPFGKNMTSPHYYKIQFSIVAELLSTCGVTMACLQDEPDTICGFICHSLSPADISIVHYLYVKLLFRKDGVAKKLFQSINPTTPTVCSHTNKVFNSIRHKNNLITLRDYDELLKMNPDPSVAYEQQQAKRGKR
jgi:hypothetical protein